MTPKHTAASLDARRRSLVVIVILVALAAGLPGMAMAQQDLVFIHHSVGSNWLAAGLDAALVDKSYIDKRNDITYGTVVSPDSGRPGSLGSVPGDNTNMNHWILWFNDYLTHVKQFNSTTANRIIMFKSCYPISNIGSDGTEPGDPFSGTQTLANYRAVYRHPSGSGSTYTHDSYVYKPLEDIFAENPDTLFIAVTAPPLAWSSTDDFVAARARQFNNWLKNDWLTSYNTAHPTLHNVAVFDLFDILAVPASSELYANRLREEYGGSTSDSHPNTAGSQAAVQAFATNTTNFVDTAWAALGTTSYTYRRYFAEGATGSFFDCTFALANVQTTAATVRLMFLKRDGTTITHTLTVPSMGRRTVNTKDVPGMATAEFSTIVESDVPVVADRTMSWDSRGYGAHAETSIMQAASLWYLAEGATHSGFALYYLIENPNASPINVEVTYLRRAPLEPIVKTYSVLANSRYNIYVNGEGPGLASTDVSAIIRTASTEPVIVERAMYLDAGGYMYKAGHAAAGITATATDWFFAEGATGTYFDTFLLVSNPTDTTASLEVTFLLPNGDTIVQYRDVAPMSRDNFWIDTLDPRLADTAVSSRIRVTNGVGIVAERAMWWQGPTAGSWYEAHVSAGATSTGTSWAMADGEQGGTKSIETYVLLANQSSYAGSARVTIMYEDGSPAGVRVFPLSANSRLNVPVGVYFPPSVGKRFGVLVESLGTTPAQLIVERSMYWNVPDLPWAGGTGLNWAAGTNTVATRLQ